MKEIPVDLLEVVAKVQQMAHERPGKISYRVIDPKVHLYVRVDANGQSDFAYRRKKPTIVRLLGRVFDLELKTAVAMCLEMEAKVLREEEVPSRQKTALKTLTAPTVEGAESTLSMTLSDLLEKWMPHEAKSGRWDLTTGRAVTKFRGIVRNHLRPALPTPLSGLTATSIESALTAIYRKHRSMALSLRSWVCDALRWAEDEQYLENGRFLAAQVKEDLSEKWRHIKHGHRPHHAALSIDQAPAFYADLKTVSGTAARACEVAMLTTMRTSSVIQMRWRDVDLEQGIWICPAEFVKEKGNGAQVVYLSSQARKVIASMPRVLKGGRKSKWVFSTSRGERICSDLCKVIESMNARRADRRLPQGWDLSQKDAKTGSHPRVTVHGFRATFKTWSRSETLGNWQKYDSTAVELCLHHVPKDAYDGAYDREDFPTMQRQILQDWADYLDGGSTPVVSF